MEKRIICTVCPVGCEITVNINDDNEITCISGNTCPRGEKYAMEELTNPVRMLTSTVKCTYGDNKRIPVRTSQKIKKDDMMRVMEIIHNTVVTRPVKIGEVIVKDVLENIDVISCSDIL